MKTQYYTATSLDGFLATDDDSLDWLFPLGSLDESSYPVFIAEVGAVVMGSSTYEWMLRNAEAVKDEAGAAWPYTQPAWVFSSRKLPLIEGADVHFVSGDRGVTECTFSGTKADGTRIEARMVDIFTFRDGKIAVKNAFRKDRPPVVSATAQA